MWEAILVGLIVVAAALYAAWALLPATLRLRVAQRIGAWGRRPGRAAWLQRASTAVETAARRRVGACSDCSAVQAAPSPPPSSRPPTQD
jgi:hypothetical protein